MTKTSRSPRHPRTPARPLPDPGCASHLALHLAAIREALGGAVELVPAGALGAVQLVPHGPATVGEAPTFPGLGDPADDRAQVPRRAVEDVLRLLDQPPGLGDPGSSASARRRV